MKRVVFALLLGGCATAPSATRETSTIHEVPSTSCTPLDWPVMASISSGFGARDSDVHQGIDLPVPEGTPVLAACDGIVRYADDKQRGYGLMIMLEHEGQDETMTTLYAHNSELLVEVGDHVSRGQQIARSGQTGRVTAPHVHFEVRIGSKAIDPVPLLRDVARLVAR